MKVRILKHARIIGFISVKGGVGKTTTVANLGLILARDFNKKVLVVDGNFSGPNLALHFGFIRPQYTIHDVLNGKVGIQKAIYEHSSGMHLLPASLLANQIDCSKFGKHLASLRSFYDIILVDSSPSMNEEMLATIMASDELFILTTPDYVTLASTLHAVKIAKQKKTYISGIIINKVRGKKFELSLDSIQDATKVPVVGVLYDDEALLEALSKAKPLAALKDSRTVIEYKKLAAALVGERYKDKRLVAKFKGLFGKKLSPDEVNRAIVMVSHY